MNGPRHGDDVSQSVQNEGRADDQAAAVRWFSRFAETDVTALQDEELAEWAKWAEPKSRLEQFRTLGRIWGSHLRAAANDAGSRPTEAELAADDYDASVPFSQWIAERSSSKVRPLFRGRMTRLLAIAACLIAMMGAVVKYGNVQFLHRLLGEPVESYATGPSEHRNIALADGSHIILGGRTELTVHYTANRRLIFLDRGEASFSVSHDALRPFTVFAGGGAVTAIGTQFDVRRDLDPAGREHVVVIVSKGTVEVGPPMATISTRLPESIEASAPKPHAQARWIPARLVKGQGLTYGTEGPQGKIETVNLEEVEAWKEGRLEYRQIPFRVVIPRVNRYSEKPIVLADSDVGDLTYSGTVFEGQVNDWLHALEAIYPIDVTENADRILLRYDRARDKSEH